MTDDDTIARVRRAAGGPGVLTDLEAIVARGRRRRIATRTTSVAAVALALVVAGAMLITLTPSTTTVRFAEEPGTGDSATADQSTTGTVGQDGRDSAVARCPTSASVTTPQFDDAEVRNADGWPPEVEGEPVATPDGFLLVVGPPPNSAWWSADGRTWTRQRAEDLVVDVVFDVGTTSGGEVVALDAEQNLWISGDHGRSWRCASLPAGLDGPRATTIGADDRWWYVGGGRGSTVHVAAVPRDTLDEVRPVAGDFDVGRLTSDRPGVMLASASVGTVLVADARPVPTVWLVSDDLTTTRVDDPFDGGAVTGVVATEGGFLATVVRDDRAGPELWRSRDGLSWTPDGTVRPAPSCARVVESGRNTLAAGSPCGQDVGWEVWRRRVGGEWVRVVPTR